ncbi:MAG TPA: hypothetical protein VGD40_08740 [Chryseosolibacter sp.]
MNGQRFVCHPAPADKRKYIADIGKILVSDYGKKKFYKPEEVKKAHKKSTWDAYDFSCWAMSTYSSHSDFDEYHEQTGEACDYTQMKAEMLEGISVSEAVHLSDLADVDLDASWLDMGEAVGGILEGIGEFFAAILETID